MSGSRINDFRLRMIFAIRPTRMTDEVDYDTEESTPGKTIWLSWYGQAEELREFDNGAKWLPVNRRKTGFIGYVKRHGRLFGVS